LNFALTPTIKSRPTSRGARGSRLDAVLIGALIVDVTLMLMITSHFQIEEEFSTSQEA
jgi:hypothetical protein